MVVSFLASHNGSAARDIIEAIREGRLDATIGIVITNNKDASIRRWCLDEGIPCHYFSATTHVDENELDLAIANTFEAYQSDLIVLSGYMKKIGDLILKQYANKILNIHPSLLPKHGGAGLFGDKVHEHVLQSGDTKSGATVHRVTKDYDEGPILAQKEVEVFKDDTVSSLKERVQSIEASLYIEVIQSLLDKERLECSFFNARQCSSCESISLSYAQQLEEKEYDLQQRSASFMVKEWKASVNSPTKAFRNRAKMVALGFAHEPKLGIINERGEEISLTQCPLYTVQMQEILAGIEQWIKVAGLPPYKIERKKGELKYVLMTQTQANAFMVRFVLASIKRLESIKEHLSVLLEQFPMIEVVTVNIQPLHMARLEGEEEIFLTPKKALEEHFNGVPLYIQPKSFFQTNSYVASRLYAHAKELSRTLDVKGIWDLFCGVGGFGLHCATKKSRLVGIEIEPNAIASAKLSAKALGLEHVSFQALDLKLLTPQNDEVPDLLIVNPPRRGLGVELSEKLNAFAPKYIFYSSCNAATLAEDLKAFSDYSIEHVRLFDMFPHTKHYEVFVYLKKL